MIKYMIIRVMNRILESFMTLDMIYHVLFDHFYRMKFFSRAKLLRYHCIPLIIVFRPSTTLLGRLRRHVALVTRTRVDRASRIVYRHVRMATAHNLTLARVTLDTDCKVLPHVFRCAKRLA